MFTWTIATQFAQQYTSYALSIFAAYIPCVYGIQYLIRNKEPLPLEKPLMVWNSLLSFFSFTGFCLLVNDTLDMNFMDRIMDLQTMSTGTSGIVIFIFNLSKIVELMDTLFIVFRKKPLLILHTYHHLVTGIYSWSTLLYPTPLGLWMATNNLGVHSIMYGYYAANYFKIKIMNPKYITTIQIIQMIWGIIINFIYICNVSSITNIDWFHFIYGTIMYGSYLYLFCKFYNRRYNNSEQNYIKKNS